MARRCVESHPNANLYFVPPGVCGESALAGGGGGDGVSCTIEEDEEGVALRIDFLAALLVEGHAKKPAMLREHAAVAVRQSLNELG